jgi:hypothetical protein
MYNAMPGFHIVRDVCKEQKSLCVFCTVLKFAFLWTQYPNLKGFSIPHSRELKMALSFAKALRYPTKGSSIPHSGKKAFGYNLCEHWQRNGTPALTLHY